MTTMSKLGIHVSGKTEREAVREAVRRFGVDPAAIEYILEENDEDLLEGAEPEVEILAWIKPEWIAERAEKRLTELLEHMDIKARVDVTIEEWVVRLDVNAGKAANVLIGKDGQNLMALQYLINRMVLPTSRQAPMILIDIEGYRRKQFDQLEDLVERAVARARETGNEIELDSMPPSIRKYLHNYLRRHEDIKTFSRGEDPDRYLVIIAD